MSKLVDKILKNGGKDVRKLLSESAPVENEAFFTDIADQCEKMYNVLDQLQETDLAQADEDFMFEIGEAMGYLDNVVDILLKKIKEM